MTIRRLLGAAALTTLTLGAAGVGAAHAEPAVYAARAVHASSATSTKHACTRTSSGSCIQGGEFCPQADYGHSGYSASGKRYVCKGDRTHPHWENP